jgi:eukaryotic-like serine/threonine-protein kinase
MYLCQARKPVISLSQLAGQWSTISELLDRVLALSPHERIEFVNGLQGDAAEFRETLLQLLSQTASNETDDFLRTLPRLSAGAAPASLADVSRGELIGPYRLIEELGAGGMGAVWIAERADGSLKRKVALKLPRLAWGRGLAERMGRERDILASLEHPNIARLYDAGEDQHGRPYLALEYVEGQPIDAYARANDLALKERLKLLMQVASAVSFAHSRLVIHRDLKPANILVTADSQVRLLDFGIAKLMEGDSAAETQLTQFAGRALTLDYSSPEQIKGDTIGTASDVYSLGVVAFELLTESKPYRLERGSAAELEEAIAAVDAPLASAAAAHPALSRSLKGDLDAILNKALKKSPAERYLTVEAFSEDVRKHLAGEPVSARPDSTVYRLRKLVARRKLETAVVAMVLVALVGGAYAQVAVSLALAAGTAVALWQRNRAMRAAARAEEQTRVAQTQTERAERVKRFLLSIFVYADTDSGSEATATALDLLRKAGREIASLDVDAATLLELRTALAGALLSMGQAADAIGLLESATGAAERTVGVRHPALLSARARLGEALKDVLRSEEAVASLQETLALARDAHDLPHQVFCLSALSSALIDVGRVEEAVQRGREAARLADLVTDPARAEWRLQALTNEVNVLRQTQSAGLVDSARRALSAAEEFYSGRELPPVSLLVARAMWADAEVKEGDARAGIEAYERLFDTWVRTLGEEHGLTSALFSWAGVAYTLWGDPDRALACLQRSLRITEKLHGADSLNRAIGLLNIGKAELARGRPSAAAELAQRAIEMLSRVAPGHPVRRRCLEFQVTALLAGGRVYDAEVLDGGNYWANPPAAEPDSTLWQVRRSALWLAKNRRAEAREECLAAIERLDRVSDRIARCTSATLAASVLNDLTLGQRSMSVLVPAMETLAACQSDSSTLLAEARLQAGRACLQVGDAMQAVAYLTEADRIWSLHPDCAIRGRVLAHLCLARKAAGGSEASRSLVDEAIALLKSIDDPRDAALIERLGGKRRSEDCS